jgi:predicted O-linked N-acetylglucosamine transferase (SPINDLY family)
MAEAWKHLAIALEAQGDSSLALVHARRALQLGLTDLETLQLVARLAQASGLPKDAIRAFELIVSQWPDNAKSWASLAQCHLAANQLDKAEAAARRALSIDEALPGGWACLGITLGALGKTGEAEPCLEKALNVDVNLSEAFNALGQILLASGRKAAAEQLCTKVLQRQPHHVEALYTLGTLQMEAGRLVEARRTFSRVAKLAPARLSVRSTLLFIDNYLEDQPATERLREAIRFGRDASSSAQAKLPPWSGDRHPRRLRVGLLSPDLRAHPVGYFIEGILCSEASKSVDWFSYSSAPYTDETTARLRPHFANWRNLNGLSDADCARLIHSDGVHVLVDLAGHTLFNRLPVLAWRAAPIQVSWLGYFATTGLPTIDYLIADADCLPNELEDQFVERIWRLPTRLCFTPPQEAPAVRATPSSEGVPVTFGCFQAHPKITDELLLLWSRLLYALPSSRLRLQNAQLGLDDEKTALQGRLARAGIDPSRVELAGRVPRRRYLEDLGAVDLLLDTHPYPGGTTTCEALWMGVPTVTLAGNSMLARQGASILRAAGLPDWVAHSPDEYVELAIRKAKDTLGLAALRQDLRQKLPQTPLFDANGFASSLVDALSTMWACAAEQASRQK